ncbi:MAG TPA: hypothetical protein VLK85_35660, partial [Ramlibacter sp.]|nr:hypothetical protein [Ramlibacter sp.]
GWHEVLVVHGDVPLLTAAELDWFLGVHGEMPGAAVTVAPDRWRGGTNLLAWRGLPGFRAQYGQDSFRRHCAAARERGARLSVCTLPGAAIDVDEPDDLQVVRVSACGAQAPRTQGVLGEIVGRVCEATTTWVRHRTLGFASRNPTYEESRCA